MREITPSEVNRFIQSNKRKRAGKVREALPRVRAVVIHKGQGEQYAKRLL